MEFKAKRDSLLATLYWTQSIVERRNTMPILANVLIEAQRGSLRITATDLEVGVRGEVESDIGKEGTVTINAKKIYEIIREVPNQQVQIKRLENDWVEVRSGKSVFKIVGMRQWRVSDVISVRTVSSIPSGRTLPSFSARILS